MVIQKINKTISTVLKYGLLFLITAVSQISAQTNEMTYILINGNLLTNLEESEWLKGPSTILVKNTLGDTNVELEIIPDSGSIEIISDSLFPVSIYIKDQIQERQIIRFPNNIVEYKIGIKADDESGNKYLYFSARLGNEINYNKWDLLIVPAAYKFSKKFFRIFFKSETTLQIHGND